MIKDDCSKLRQNEVSFSEAKERKEISEYSLIGGPYCNIFSKRLIVNPYEPQNRKKSVKIKRHFLTPKVAKKSLKDLLIR